MLLNCSSCQKKFVVPDNAISESGRLVQCGSCGNKWKQYPIKNIKKEINILKNKKSILKEPRPKKNLYTAEYLQKKHGLVIDGFNAEPNKKILDKKNKKSTFGFYSYIIFFFVFFVTLFGILNFTKNLIIQRYPFSEIYINYFYEVFEIIKISLAQFIN